MRDINIVFPEKANPDDTADVLVSVAEALADHTIGEDGVALGAANAWVMLFTASLRAARARGNAEFLSGCMIRNLPLVISWAGGSVAMFEEEDHGEEA